MININLRLKTKTIKLFPSIMKNLPQSKRFLNKHTKEIKNLYFEQNWLHKKILKLDQLNLIIDLKNISMRFKKIFITIKTILQKNKTDLSYLEYKIKLK